MKNDYFWQKNNVLLRSLKESDADMLYDALCDTSLRMQAEGGIALPVTCDTATEMIEYAIEMTKEGNQLWFAVVDNENRLVGYAILGYLDERNGNVQCDVTIFPKYEEKDCGKNTYDILLRYAFYERRLHKVNTFIMEGNESGRKHVLDAGFVLEAHRKAQFFSGGKYFSQDYYGITKNEFENLHAKKKSKLFKETAKTAGKLKLLLEERPYFWLFENIVVREMTKEDYLKNREMLFLSKDARFYDNDVKLPPVSDELTEREEEHLGFGGDGTRLEFAVVNTDGEYVGNVNLHSIDKKNGTFSVSFYFLKKERQKGYATNAVALIVYYAFNELRLNKLNVCVNEGNVASESLIQRIGCKPEGIWRENVFYDGKYTDVMLYGMTGEEFHAYLMNKE
ncbi:MAG: GNAT family N-acetyltransferase [Lachnospiraceae bacterium]|nr:GNAT family N-acetyltransferase [Lachnospiraceae bacterium]